VIVDPSHAAGRADWVPALALAAVAAGADGLLIESHPVPAESWSDAAQAITPETLEAIIAGAAVLAPMLRGHQAAELASTARSSIRWTWPWAPCSRAAPEPSTPCSGTSAAVV